MSDEPGKPPQQQVDSAIANEMSQVFVMKYTIGVTTSGRICEEPRWNAVPTAPPSFT